MLCLWSFDPGRPPKPLPRDLTRSHEILNTELENRRLTEQQLRDTNRELDTFVRTSSYFDSGDGPTCSPSV
jgi:hypothetical protein